MNFNEPEKALKRILATICHESDPTNLSLPESNTCFYNVGKPEKIKSSSVSEPNVSTTVKLSLDNCVQGKEVFIYEEIRTITEYEDAGDCCRVTCENGKARVSIYSLLLKIVSRSAKGA